MQVLPQFVLASASPARHRLLRSVGIEPIVQPSHLDESQIIAEDPATLVRILAQQKAATVARTWHQSGEKTLVMGCDSVLGIHGKIHGKPDNAQVAIERWRQMRGQVGQLYTGHALIDLSQDRALVDVAVTEVHFAPVTDAQIEAYVATEEPLHCAGCFALEGRGGLFVDRLEGCHTNVIGLSLPLLRRMLTELGYEVTAWWGSPPATIAAD